MRQALALGLFVILVACGTRMPDEEARTEQASRLVRALFFAVDEHDCPAIDRMLGGFETEEKCAELYHEWEEHEMRLLSIPEASVDARDERAVIVKARVMKKGEESIMLVRVEWSPDGWKLVF